MTTRRLRISAGRHHRRHTPIVWSETNGAALRQPMSLRGEDGSTLPVQIRSDGRSTTFHAVLPELRAGATATFELRADDSAPTPNAGVTVREQPRGLDVSVDGELLTSYLSTGDGIVRPYCYPVFGPGGVMVTRRFPMERGVPGETADHPHHRSLYVAYGEANDVDNWSEQKEHGYTRHQGFGDVESGPVFGAFTAHGIWTDHAGAPLLQERRTMTFYRQPDAGRAIDMTVVWTADRLPVTFGDTKEGGILSIRVASSMDGKRGGVIENSYGGLGEAETWGRRAEWCDYSGDVDGRVVGIAAFDHPANFRAPTYWHVRDYGLMTTNVFGGEAFTSDPARNGRYTLETGKSLTFQYRLFIHAGNASEARITDRYHDFINPPKVEPL